MLSRVWAVCTTKRGKTRRENRSEMGENDYFSVVTLFQSLLSLSRDEEDEGLQAMKISSCFPNSSSCSFKEKVFFPCLCMTTQKSSSASNFAWTFFVFSKASGSWEQRRNLFRFSYENLWRLAFLRLWHCVSLVKKFMSLVRGYWNCKDHGATSTVVIICLLAVWISDLLPRMNGFSSVQFVPITQSATNSQRCNLLQLCNQFFKCF